MVILAGYVVGIIITKILLNKYDVWNADIPFEHTIIAICWVPLLIIAILAAILASPFYLIERITLGKKND